MPWAREGERLLLFLLLARLAMVVSVRKRKPEAHAEGAAMRQLFRGHPPVKADFLVGRYQCQAPISSASRIVGGSFSCTQLLGTAQLREDVIDANERADETAMKTDVRLRDLALSGRNRQHAATLGRSHHHRMPLDHFSRMSGRAASLDGVAARVVEIIVHDFHYLLVHFLCTSVRAAGNIVDEDRERDAAAVWGCWSHTLKGCGPRGCTRSCRGPRCGFGTLNCFPSVPSSPAMAREETKVSPHSESEAISLSQRVKVSAATRLLRERPLPSASVRPEANSAPRRLRTCTGPVLCRCSMSRAGRWPAPGRV